MAIDMTGRIAKSDAIAQMVTTLEWPEDKVKKTLLDYEVTGMYMQTSRLEQILKLEMPNKGIQKYQFFGI